MKKFKSLIVLLVILAIAMSMMVACKPAEEEDDIATTVANNQTATNPDGAGTTTDGTGTTTDGTGTTTDGTGTTTDGTGTTTDGTGTTTDGTGTTTDGTGTTTDGTGTTTDGTGTTTDGSSSSTTTYSNPLLNPNKQYNRNAAVSYNIDEIGFSKGTLADLKGKTLTLYTGVDYAMFSYRNSNEKDVNEWAWFKEIKKLYGVSVKYIRCSPGGSNVVKPFQAMSAGKDCDLITTHVASYPYICNILAPLNNYCDFTKFKNNPGLDPMMTETTKWKGKYIALGPNCVNGGFNYNATFVANAGLEDPYTLWKKGEWTWTNFKKYMNGLPAKTDKGKTVYGCATWSQYWYWAPTNGKPCFEIDGDNPNGGIINNWDTPEVKETYTWLENVCDTSQALYYNGNGGSFFWNTDKTRYTVMSYGRCGVDVRGILEEENKSNKYKWVPFPYNEKNSEAKCHLEIYGFGIGIPKKTNKPGNVTAAVKFMDLWCNRYTESEFDNLRYESYWTNDEVIEYYEFGQTNGVMGIGSGVGALASKASSATKFNASIAEATYSTATEYAKLSNYAKQEVANVLKFGAQ